MAYPSLSTQPIQYTTICQESQELYSGLGKKISCIGIMRTIRVDKIDRLVTLSDRKRVRIYYPTVSN